MRILLDTNVLVYREENLIISDNLQQLLRAINSSEMTTFVHPESVREIRNDPNESRKLIKLSKVGTYPILDQPPNPNDDGDFLDIVGVGSQKKHDDVDKALLFAVYKDAVHFLITEDKGIHKKALSLSIKDRVLSIEEGVALFVVKTANETIVSPIVLKHIPAYKLDIRDPIFDSLKEEYLEFAVWWQKISRQGRMCWVFCNNDGTIGALLIYKLEDEAVELASAQALSRKKRLKISTLKVSHKQQGHKIGELFIKLFVEYAQKNNLSEIYLTHYVKEPDFLVGLIEEYGFRQVGVTPEDNEAVFAKNLFPDKDELKALSPIDISKKYWPTFCDSYLVGKFIVPIRPEYHNRLFMEGGHRQTLLQEHSGELISEGNAIEKAYLSHANIKKITAGDVLLFYRSQDRHEITTLGIVEKVRFEVTDVDEIIKLVGKRSVYSTEEIRFTAMKPTTVILFSWHLNLPHPLSLNVLRQKQVTQTAPQTIMQISHERYLNIKTAGCIDERFTVN